MTEAKHAHEAVVAARALALAHAEEKAALLKAQAEEKAAIETALKAALEVVEELKAASEKVREAFKELEEYNGWGRIRTEAETAANAASATIQAAMVKLQEASQGFGAAGHPKLAAATSASATRGPEQRQIEAKK